MARMLMVQIQVAPYIGTAYLNAATRRAGHDFAVHLVDSHAKVLGRIDAMQPSLIGFSCMTPLACKTLSLAAEIKKHFNIPALRRNVNG